ncbi:MAG: hypothetical protein JNJ54_28240 [Myxococcaceae bacterium]|nr:hypothetical protein [Myxococcaceae bacterium]
MTSRTAWRLLALGLAAVAMLPLRHDFPPILDFPEHAATIATFVDLWRGGPLADWYQTDFLHTQYWLMAVTGALLAPLVGGPAAALKVLLVAASVGLVGALLRLASRLELDERLVVVAVPLLWSRPFTLGFVPFVLATPLVVLALSELSAVAPPSRRGQALVAALALAAFFLNLASVVWLVGAAVLVALAREAGKRGALHVLHGELRAPRQAGVTGGLGAREEERSAEHLKGRVREALRPVLARVGSLTVLVLPLGAWLAFSSVTNVDASRFAVSMKGEWWSPGRLLREAPGWLMDRWSGDLDVVLLAALLFACLALLLPLGEREPSTGRWPAVALFVSTAALTLALPFSRGWLWGLSTRFLPMTLTLAPLALSWRRGLVRHLAVAAFVLVSLANAWDVERHVAAAQAEFAGVRVLEGLPPGSRLLQLSFDEGSGQVNDSIVGHAGAWHRVWNRGPNEPSFVDLPQSVLRYRDGKAPWMRPWPWEFSPNDYDNASEGPHYTFVLTRGQGPSFPPAPGAAGPAWKLLREAAPWRLWERAP